MPRSLNNQQCGSRQHSAVLRSLAAAPGFSHSLRSPRAGKFPPAAFPAERAKVHVPDVTQKSRRAAAAAAPAILPNLSQNAHSYPRSNSDLVFRICRLRQLLHSDFFTSVFPCASALAARIKVGEGRKRDRSDLSSHRPSAEKV